MNPLLLQNFIDLIANRTGIRVRDKDQAELIKKIRMRMIALKFSTPETYYHYLTPQPIQDRTDAIQKNSTKEWDSLTLLLTTGETYFFRDQGQLNLIREVILPEIIARKQQAQAISKTKPSLRIWSAGSSTGEEPYSLAIMVKELIPNYFNWDILILGTDINVASITKAKVGQFSEWSFRSVKPEIKNQYFSPINQDWILKEDIRQMVTLHTSNLLIEDYPNFNKNIYNMDIIICRNVFIYFDTSTIKTILDKFYETLSTSGYLMVGHTELHGIDTQGFVPQSHQESVIYQRSKDLPVNLSISDHPPISPTTIQLKSFTNPLISLEPVSIIPRMKDVQTFFDNGEYGIVIIQAKQILKQTPNNFKIIYLMAQSYANLGLYDKAIDYCEQAIALDSLCTDIYYLLAHIAEEKNQIDQAKKYLKRIIYLDQGAIAAYLDLSALYQTEGDTPRAKKMFGIAIELLQALPLNNVIRHRKNIKVADLLQQISNQ